VVCNDYPVFRTITGSIQKLQGRMNCAPSTSSARDYISRRKIDGIIIDLGIEGALELVDGVRKGTSNRFSVVFACVRNPEEATSAIQAGANFVVHRPLTEEKMFQTLNAAASMMSSERRRYFRYPLMLPVTLKSGGNEARATMSNLSEGGMAVWCLSEKQTGSDVSFSFEIPFGGLIQGKGEVAWVNAEGLIGIKFHILQDNAYLHLSKWIRRREIEPGG
jgi:DNA-binding response OmpR family regulator